jgi:hypothetical protein
MFSLRILPALAADPASLSLLALFAASLAGGVAVLRKMRRLHETREQDRRILVNLRGRLSDANVTGIEGSTVYYSYTVRGVGYDASQDISDLLEPQGITAGPGPSWVKYLPENPANSIIVCEKWSGLPPRPTHTSSGIQVPKGA